MTTGHAPASGTQARTASAYERRMVIFDPADNEVSHGGRARVAAAVLRMTPVQEEPSLCPPPAFVVTQALWGIVGGNGVPIALRARTFASASEARRDGNDLADRLMGLTARDVADPLSGLHSLWFCLDRRVVLVAAQAWTHHDERRSQRLLGALYPRVPWGPVAPTAQDEMTLTRR